MSIDVNFRCACEKLHMSRCRPLEAAVLLCLIPNSHLPFGILIVKEKVQRRASKIFIRLNDLSYEEKLKK